MQIVIAAFLIVLVLLQKSGSDSLGGISGSSSSMNPVLSSKASASILTKITMILIAVFMVNCLILAVLAGNKKSISSEIDKIVKQQEIKEPVKVAPAAPLVE